MKGLGLKRFFFTVLVCKDIPSMKRLGVNGVFFITVHAFSLIRWILFKNDNNVTVVLYQIFLNLWSLRLANSHLKYSSSYRLCQSKLLREEIRQKKSAIRILRKGI